MDRSYFIAVFAFTAVTAALQHDNTTIVAGNATLEDRIEVDKTTCVPPPNAVKGEWQYQSSKYERFVGCTYKHDAHGYWIMLNSYRSGGLENVHWKFVKEGRYGDCLGGYGDDVEWVYYDKKGVNAIAVVEGFTTTISENAPWCAMRTYRKGGVRGYQWEYCTGCPPAD